MNENHNPPTGNRRKRIPIQREYVEPVFSDNRKMLLHDLEVKCDALEERNRKLTERIEEYHVQMQQANSKTAQLQKKIKGVLLHVKQTADQQTIPGTQPKGTPLEQENELLRWKLNVINKYLHGIFPEISEVL
ncbi:hypothetical protein SAMN05421788_10139 [Filimonas lacunae]|uniref:Uncharacterized protein n=1 Tax=Filimonas lacunae TaxID=477680 RepID=A0A173MM68_9BACT|nr:hypothetical protein [Filimonas lacunae]BAV08577.1 hypothetical protein FLA_4623 [Filimonas lacunae]SIS57509.1 hypothetical protein SAMN05421788_10139 [Filimonas lacunae]